MSLLDAFGGIAPLMLHEIAAQRPLEEVLGFGSFMASQVADNEITAASDEAFEAAKPPRAVGWEGIVYGPDDPCIGNAGRHDFGTPMYRHPSCRCERRVVFEEGA